jgi:hypothetical protein
MHSASQTRDVNNALRHESPMLCFFATFWNNSSKEQLAAIENMFSLVFEKLGFCKAGANLTHIQIIAEVSRLDMTPWSHGRSSRLLLREAAGHRGRFHPPAEVVLARPCVPGDPPNPRAPMLRNAQKHEIIHMKYW